MAAGDSHKAWLNQALHALGQPLTALECRLFVATLEAKGADDSTAVKVFQTAVEESLIECRRLFVLVRSMQEYTGAMASGRQEER